jgi:hypothetical protein
MLWMRLLGQREPYKRKCHTVLFFNIAQQECKCNGRWDGFYLLAGCGVLLYNVFSLIALRGV